MAAMQNPPQDETALSKVGPEMEFTLTVYEYYP